MFKLLLRQDKPLFRNRWVPSSVQFEDKQVLANHILVAGHLEGRFDETSDTGDGAVTSAVLMQLHKPLLGIRDLDRADLAITKVLLLDQIQNKN